MRKIWKAGSAHDDAARLERELLHIGRCRGIRDFLGDEGEAHGLTPAQVHALVWMGHDGPLTMGELAHRCGITEKTITGIVDRLERAALARRARDPADRRLVRATLTDAGAAVFGAIHAQVLDDLASLLVLLDPGDRLALFRILQKLSDRLASGHAGVGGEVA